MVFLASIVLFFHLACGLSVVQARKFNSILTVPNGGRWGHWGAAQFCRKGHAVGFVLKEKVYIMNSISTSLDGISLLCDDGGIIESLSGPWGLWQHAEYCSQGKLEAFALRVQDENDITAVCNVKFVCSDNTVLVGSGSQGGRFGPLSNHCKNGSICGMQIRALVPEYVTDDAILDDVIMYCCD